MNHEQELRELLVKQSILEMRITEMEELLKMCYPYIETHYLRSSTTFGQNALKIMNRIQKLIKI